MFGTGTSENIYNKKYLHTVGILSNNALTAKLVHVNERDWRASFKTYATLKSQPQTLW